MIGLGLLLTVVASAAGSYGRSPCEDGASHSLVVANESGDLLTTWQQAEGEERNSCHHSVAVVAIGSTTAGFTDLGAVSTPGQLSFPTGAFLDNAGDAWVVGVNEHYAGSDKYEAEYERAGAWVAFRPAGDDFQAPVELPTGSSLADSVLVAGNRAGRAVIAWSNEHGTYLAWGTPTGRLSNAIFIGHRFTASGVGVDEQGHALIVRMS